MHPDVVKLVEAGRINEAVGEKLSKIAPGSYRIHKGFGEDWPSDAVQGTGFNEILPACTTHRF